MLSDVLDSLPSCFVLPFGGMSCSSLALFSAFCWALRSRAGLARDGKQIRMGDGCLLSVLPSILNDPAPRAALLGIWAQRFRAQMTDFMSRLTGVPPQVGRTPLFSIDGHMQRAEHRTRLLDTLVPIVEETVMDLWLVHRCQEKMTFSHHQYEREYVGTYSTIREASRESAEAFNKRVNLIVSEYRRRVYSRAVGRRRDKVKPPKNLGNRWYDEATLSEEQIKTLPPPGVDMKEQALTNHNISERDSFQVHAPFNTRELLDAAGGGRVGSA